MISCSLHVQDDSACTTVMAGHPESAHNRQLRADATLAGLPTR